jgi:hypothetical protein
MALVRERTIPTERPLFVGEVSANFCGRRVFRGQRNESPRPYPRISTPKPKGTMIEFTGVLTDWCDIATPEFNPATKKHQSRDHR